MRQYKAIGQVLGRLQELHEINSRKHDIEEKTTRKTSNLFIGQIKKDASAGNCKKLK